ncbi:MAG: hypothetical protein Q9199_001665 [Rusavskia elegans]
MMDPGIKPDLLELGNYMDALEVHESDDQLIIGLDFGTTFSYDPNQKTSFTWGAQKHKHAKIEGMKLLLDPGQETPLYIPETNTAAELKKLGKPATDVVTDYITAIYKHALNRIETKIPAEYLKMCQKKFVVTVPAVWSAKAMNATLLAAKQAGIHPVSLIKEPEAAALYTLRMLQDKALAIGDAFVLCDAGGGTVDLISYEITTLAPTLELKELVTGKVSMSKGGMAGSLGVNKRFAQAVQNIVGEDQFFHLRKETGFEEAMKQFDKTIKTAFRGDLDEDYYVNFPRAKLDDDLPNRLEANCWNMKGADVKKIFQPLITDIERMVEDQVNLVRVKRLNEGHPKANEIKVRRLHAVVQKLIMIPKRPSSSSAALDQASISSNACKRPIRISKSSNPRMHGQRSSSKRTNHECLDLFIELQQGCGTEPVARGGSNHFDRFNKALRRLRKCHVRREGRRRPAHNNTQVQRKDAGRKDMRRDQKIIFPFKRSLADDYSPSKLIFSDDLLECSLDQAVKYPKKGVTSTNCRMTADLTSVSKDHFHTKTALDGTPYYEVHYHLVISTKTAIMKFSLEVDGEEMGSIEASYE